MDEFSLIDAPRPHAQRLPAECALRILDCLCWRSFPPGSAAGFAAGFRSRFSEGIRRMQGLT